MGSRLASGPRVFGAAGLETWESIRVNVLPRDNLDGASEETIYCHLRKLAAERRCFSKRPPFILTFRKKSPFQHSVL